MSQSGRRRETVDDYDIEQDLSVFSRGLDVLVPAVVAHNALAVRVETDRDVYGPDEHVDIQITIANRLPLPIQVRLANWRVWGWAVDGYVEAIDEPLYVPERPRALALRARETRTFDREWDRRIRRGDSPARWVEAEPGEHEISAFVSTEPPRTHSTTITLR